MYNRESLALSDLPQEEASAAPVEQTAAAEKEHELDAEQSRQWDENHQKIMQCIHRYMQSNYGTPTITFIAEKVGLSRLTVRRHMQNFHEQPNFKEHTAMYKLMATSVLRQLYSQCMYGNVKASRLYMELMGVIQTGRTTVNNNFVGGWKEEQLKLNEVEITEELIDNLKPEYKTKIESLLKEAISGNPLPKNEKTLND